MKNFSLAIFTALAGLTFALCIAEILIRLVWVPPSTLSTISTEKHPYYGWAPRPGITGRQVSIEFDYIFSNTAQGLRGNNIFTQQLPAGIDHRILFLGDSFTYGNGSDNTDTFVELIHARLDKTQVINTGANGYGQAQQLAILDTLGKALNPDLVVLMFFWNDIEDNIKDGIPTFSISGANRIVRTDIKVPNSFDPLALRQASETGAKQETKPWRRTYLYKLFKEGARGFRHRVFGSRERDIQTPEQREHAWRATKKLLEMIKLNTESMGAKLLVVSIPDYELVSPNGKLLGQELINISIEDQLRLTCEELGIEYFDLLSELTVRQAESTEALYFQTDRHLTPLGNAEVASVLTPLLQSMLK